MKNMMEQQHQHRIIVASDISAQQEGALLEKARRDARADRMDEVIRWIKLLGVPLILASLGWAGSAVLASMERITAKLETVDARTVAMAHSLSERLTAIEASRFTSDDAIAIQATITQLWREITERAKKDEVPPAWFRAQVDKIDAELHHLRARVDSFHSKGGS